MALPNVQFVKSTSGLGGALPGTDHISGYVHYYPSGGTLPTGFTTNDRIKKIFSVAEAEALGITDTSLGETKAVATLLVTTAGTAGDTVTITYDGIEEVKTGDTLTIIDAYELVTADVVSTTTAAAAIAAAINVGTATHGFTATNSTATILITTKAGEGIFPNSGTPYAFTSTGTFAGTLTQPTGAGSTVLGVAGFIDTAHYHISEFFRINPKGVLYVGFYVEESSAYAYADVTTVINYAQGEIKQLGIYHKNIAFVTSQVTALQSVITAAVGNYKPFQAMLGAEISGTASLATITTDLAALSSPNVSVTIAQDGYADGYHLFKAVGKSIGAVGTMLGAVSLAKVSDSIAWVAKFNMAAVEHDTLAFSNGEAYKGIADSQLDQLNTYGFVFMRKFPDLSGSYWSDSKTCTATSSDYSTIENNRTYFKITRNVRANMLPALSSPIKVNADGTLSAGTIGYFESLANSPLEQMEANDELSGYKIVIDPAQDVLATSTVELTLQNIPLGVARIIKVNVGFVTSI